MTGLTLLTASDVLTVPAVKSIKIARGVKVRITYQPLTSGWFTVVVSGKNLVVHPKLL